MAIASTGIGQPPATVRTLAVIGAGPGVGMAVARRFGREAYQVALIARSPDKLDAYVAELRELGITAAGFRADITDQAQLADALSAAADRFGGIDVIEYSPMISYEILRPVLSMDAESVQKSIAYYLTGPVVAVNAVLEPMLSKGEGALLFTSGASAVATFPSHGNISAAMGGLRQYVRMLNTALAHRGVFAGNIIIAKPHDPAEIADLFWDMMIRRDRVEEVYGELRLGEAYELLVARGFGPGFPPGLTMPLPEPRDAAERRIFLLGLYQARINAHWHPDPDAATRRADEEAQRLGGEPLAPYYGVDADDDE